MKTICSGGCRYNEMFKSYDEGIDHAEFLVEVYQTPSLLGNGCDYVVVSDRKCEFDDSIFGEQVEIIWMVLPEGG